MTALESRRQSFVSVAELGQGPIDDIDRVHPPEQRGMDLGQLERELGAVLWLGDQAQRFVQALARGLAPGASLG